MDTLQSRYQHQYIRDAHHQREQLQAREQVDLSHDHDVVKSTTTTTRSSSSSSSVYDVTDDDVISSLRHSSSQSVSTLSRPLYIHRPFEESLTPLQLKNVQRSIDDRGRDYRLHEPRHGWLAHQHYQLGSAADVGCTGSWQRQQLETTVKVGDDEVDSSGDSACCDDDDVCDSQVLEAKMNDARRRAAYSDVSSDDTATRSESKHCQSQHQRKSGSYGITCTNLMLQNTGL